LEESRDHVSARFYAPNSEVAELEEFSMRGKIEGETERWYPIAFGILVSSIYYFSYALFCHLSQ
jgi:hypothetical protein